jgi:hypothetical protein
MRVLMLTVRTESATSSFIGATCRPLLIVIVTLSTRRAARFSKLDGPVMLLRSRPGSTRQPDAGSPKFSTYQRVPMCPPSWKHSRKPPNFDHRRARASGGSPITTPLLARRRGDMFRKNPVTLSVRLPGSRGLERRRRRPAGTRARQTTGAPGGMDLRCLSADIPAGVEASGLSHSSTEWKPDDRSVPRYS